MYEDVHICIGQRLTLKIICDRFSTVFIEAGSRSNPELTDTAVCVAEFALLSQAGFTSRPVNPPGTYLGPGYLNSAPQPCDPGFHC